MKTCNYTLHFHRRALSLIHSGRFPAPFIGDWRVGRGCEKDTYLQNQSREGAGKARAHARSCPVQTTLASEEIKGQIRACAQKKKPQVLRF